jgi:hypothetical protein
MKFVLYFLVLTMLLISIVGSAQHPHQHPPSEPAKPLQDTVKKQDHQHGEMDHSEHQSLHTMPSHAFSRNLPMNRNSSGTAWNPDETPMYMLMKQARKADWMFHGSIFLRYTNTDIFKSGSRGGDKIDAPNWFMAMMNRKVGNRGLLNATAMISLDRLTEGGAGYPLLYQSGETFNGERLVDKQHPHDLFSALSIGYTQMINKDMDVFGYIGYPGEPALGAPAFMHRISSMNNPNAPLSHHWQDATHITFGVATAGLRYKAFKIEGSSFTGREPDEDRYDFDKARFDSWSYRLSYNPTANWAIQFSQGFINSPEVLEPGEDVTRTTASVLYAKQTDASEHFSAALIWGLNDKGDHHKEHSLLAESNYQFGKNAFYNRYEFIQKSTEELALEDELGHYTANIHTLSLGYNRSVWQQGFAELTVGTQATFSIPGDRLKPIYGDNPVGFQVYLQLRPVIHNH